MTTWQRAVLRLDGPRAVPPSKWGDFTRDVQDHWGFYLFSCALTVTVCTAAIEFLLG